ncbi:hypothetical protein ACPPVT_09825 [Angustibacter sp. McL0619]|uniref:hypothetical protein n=1 Tax=Angustibacter sp. McL0619 TaxID=3415676 RepID=UPI003CFB326E
MVDATVIWAAAITGIVGLSGAALEAITSRRSLRAENRRAEIDRAVLRRRERQATYEAVLDAVSNWAWDSTTAASDYDVVERFSKPFNLAAIRIRLYGSDATIAATDDIQRGFAMLNRAEDSAAATAASSAIWQGVDRFVDAAREDVGPRADDELRKVDFQRGAGPRA